MQRVNLANKLEKLRVVFANMAKKIDLTANGGFLVVAHTAT